jgi:hypothetical protein
MYFKEWLILTESMSEDDAIQMLGLSWNFTPQELKAAYNRKVWKNHPDRNPGLDKNAKIADINQAYEILNRDIKPKKLKPQKSKSIEPTANYPTASHAMEETKNLISALTDEQKVTAIILLENPEREKIYNLRSKEVHPDSKLGQSLGYFYRSFTEKEEKAIKQLIKKDEKRNKEIENLSKKWKEYRLNELIIEYFTNQTSANIYSNAIQVHPIKQWGNAIEFLKKIGSLSGKFCTALSSIKSNYFHKQTCPNI